MAKNIHEALEQFQKDLPTIGFDSVNPHFKSRFATLGKITGVVLPRLNQLGVVYVSGGQVIDGQLMFVSELIHTESGTSISSALPFGVTDAQKIGSAITYFRRYSLSAMLGILTDEDDDGNVAQDKSVQPPREWRARVAEAQSTDDLNAIYGMAKGDGWLTDEVMKALTARKEALSGANTGADS